MNGSFCSLCSLAFVLALHYYDMTSLHSADKSQEGRNSRLLLRDPASSALVMFGVSKRVSRSISLAVYFLSLEKCRLLLRCDLPVDLGGNWLIIERQFKNKKQQVRDIQGPLRDCGEFSGFSFRRGKIMPAGLL